MDKFKAMLLEGYLKNKFQKYIKDNALSVELDTEKRKCYFKVSLVGEESALDVKIESFEISTEGGEKRLCITEVSANRQWLDIALNENLKGKSLKVPSLIASAL